MPSGGDSVELDEFNLPGYSPPPIYKSRATSNSGDEPISTIQEVSVRNATHDAPDQPSSPSPLRAITILQDNPNQQSPACQSAPKKREKNASFILLLNVPFILMFMIDIIGSYNPTSAFYRKNLYLKSIGGIIFHAIYVPIGLVTMLANLTFLWGSVNAVAAYKARHKQTWKATLVLSVVAFLGGAVALAPGMYPVIGIFLHSRLPRTSFHTRCVEKGFRSVIRLHAAGDGSAGNASFHTSDGSSDFRMQSEELGDGLDVFSMIVDLPHNQTFDTVSVGFNLTAHTYEFRLHDISVIPDRLIRHLGAMQDSPQGVLGFPDLYWPLHSTAHATWSSDGGNLPEIELVDSATPPHVFLKTIDINGGRCDLAITMCGIWDAIEMETDWRKFEAMAVSVGRMLVEVGNYGGSEHCMKMTKEKHSFDVE